MALKLRFDLINLLHSTVPDRKRRVALTPFINRASVKREFGERAILAIIDRTLKGDDKEGEPFTKYSKTYKDSLAFKIYGKSKNRVNLRLSGQMQSSIHVNGTDQTGVTIAITDKDEEDKAKGHINGVGSLPVRDFWGLSKSDQSKILMDIIKSQSAVSEFVDMVDSLSALGTLTASGSVLSGEEDVSEFLVGLE